MRLSSGRKRRDCVAYDAELRAVRFRLLCCRWTKQCATHLKYVSVSCQGKLQVSYRTRQSFGSQSSPSSRRSRVTAHLQYQMMSGLQTAGFRVRYSCFLTSCPRRAPSSPSPLRPPCVVRVHGASSKSGHSCEQLVGTNSCVRV